MFDVATVDPRLGHYEVTLTERDTWLLIYSAELSITHCASQMYNMTKFKTFHVDIWPWGLSLKK